MMKLNKPFIFDGAFGTYYTSLYGSRDICEMANLHYPQRVKQIHQEYVDAGAQAIKTNTFSIMKLIQECETETWHTLIHSAIKVANEAASGHDVLVFADLGPLEEAQDEKDYMKVIDVFLDAGIKNFLFETLSSDKGIHQSCEYIKAKVSDAMVIVSYAVNSDGYTRQGFGIRYLLSQLKDTPFDVFGLNCMNGPNHMKQLLKYFEDVEYPISIMPNAGYPGVLNRHSIFRDNVDYYAKECASFYPLGVSVMGGCCGTTPKHIEALVQNVQKLNFDEQTQSYHQQKIQAVDDNEIHHRLQNKEKIIAVEFDPPQDCKIDTFMRNANILQEEGVDLITIADCPIARARMDSSLLACKLHRELGLNVMPHMTCRDRNLNATKALLYGLEVEGIRNVLIVTGDPIPEDNRGEIKGVFNFNSAVLARYIDDLNETTLPHPFLIFGALNINAINFDAELAKAKRKLEHGMKGFLTQPIHSEKALNNLKKARKELDAYLLGGVMPIVSHRNGLYMHNEISGMEIDERIIQKYENTTREEAAQLAVSISNAICDEMKDFVDGYYLITPFNRVEIIQKVMQHIKKYDL